MLNNNISSTYLQDIKPYYIFTSDKDESIGIYRTLDLKNRTKEKKKKKSDLVI